MYFKFSYYTDFLQVLIFVDAEFCVCFVSDNGNYSIQFL